MKEVLTKEGLEHYTAGMKQLIDEAEPDAITEAAIDEMFGGEEVEIPETPGVETTTIAITNKIFEDGRTGVSIEAITKFANGQTVTQEGIVYNGKAGADGKSIFLYTGTEPGANTTTVNTYPYRIDHGDKEITVGDLIVATNGWLGRITAIVYSESAKTNEITVERITSLAGKDGTDGLTPYIGANGNWWTGEYDTGVSAGGSAGSGEVTEEQIAAAVEAYLAEHPELFAPALRIAEIELLAANWVGDASPYSQVVTIPGITNYSQVDLTPSVEQLAIFHDKDLAFVTENEDGVVTVYAIGDKPLNDYTMQVTIKEVSV